MNSPSSSFLASRGAAAASALLLGLVAGCGGGSSGADSTAMTQAATTSSTTPSVTASADTATTADTAKAQAASTTTSITGSTTPAASGGGKTYEVGGTGTLVAGSTRVATMMAVPWSALPAGSVVLVSPGTYSGVTTITAVGTAANPITITAADPADPPVLTNSFDFQGAAYVTVSHVTVQAPTYAAFIIRLGSNHVTVSDSTINKAPEGIDITDGAGIGHQILRNTIADSVTNGINAEVNSDATVRTLIQHNTIERSGVHGMEIRASDYQIEYNAVSQSGYANGGGASGIHIYRGSPSENSGAGNLVRYNMSYENEDKVAYDGNGIEVDQWCDGNTVAFNQVWGNDGAGVIVYDGSDNIVQNNTAASDGVNSGGTHVSLGEIIVSGTSAATVKGNHVWNNIVSSARAGVPAMYVDTRAVAGGNTIGANLYFNEAGGTVMRWTDSTIQQTPAAIDAVTKVVGSVVALAHFTNGADATAGGLKPSVKSTLDGLMPTGLLDYAGTSPVSGQSFMGAYYTSP